MAVYFQSLCIILAESAVVTCDDWGCIYRLLNSFHHAGAPCIQILCIILADNTIVTCNGWGCTSYLIHFNMLGLHAFRACASALLRTLLWHCSSWGCISYWIDVYMWELCAFRSCASSVQCKATWTGLCLRAQNWISTQTATSASPWTLATLADRSCLTTSRSNNSSLPFLKISVSFLYRFFSPDCVTKCVSVKISVVSGWPNMTERVCVGMFSG